MKTATIDIPNSKLSIKELVLYETLDEMMDAFMEKLSGDPETILRGFTKDGNEWECTVQLLKEKYRKAGVFGFVEDRMRMHIWFDAQTITDTELVRVIGHELGHLQRPFHRQERWEEAKANLYGHISAVAYNIASILVKEAVNDSKDHRPAQESKQIRTGHTRRIYRVPSRKRN